MRGEYKTQKHCYNVSSRNWYSDDTLAESVVLTHMNWERKYISRQIRAAGAKRVLGKSNARESKRASTSIITAVQRLRLPPWEKA